MRVNLTSLGDENALGFNLSFDPVLFSYAGVSLGSAASAGTLNVNTNQLSSGRLGFVLALPTDTNFMAGTREVLKVNLRATAGSPGSYPVSFTNQPVPTEVSDKTATVLAAGYVNGTVVVNPAPTLQITRAGPDIVLAWPLWASNFVAQAADAGLPPVTWTNVAGTVVVSNAENVVTLPITGATKFYRLSIP